MADDRRLTTDRFYGGTSRRITLLQQFLSFVAESEPDRSVVKDWILDNTPAQSRDTVDRHLGFLSAIELTDLSDESVSISQRGKQYLDTPEPAVLYEALKSNVKGFDTILRALKEEPMTDEEIMVLLKQEFAEINMNSPGVASRHREWLQVLGYVDRTDGTNQLTENGRRLLETADEGTNRSASERVTELRERLLEAEMAAIPAGRRHLINEIYPAIERAYPHLCDDSYLCKDAHESGVDQPEWKHAVRDIQQRLADREGTRVRRLGERNMWQFLPRFDPGTVYSRSRLHDQLGGQRQRGISPCSKADVILLFTSFSDTEEGYRDTIEEDGTVVYTGEGREGDMTFAHGNKAVGNHREDNRELHLFQTLNQGTVRYIGQYQCHDYTWGKLSDTNGKQREAIQFELRPTDPEFDFSAVIETDSGGESIGPKKGSDTVERRTTTQDRIVRDRSLVRYLKELYDDSCQICGNRRLQDHDIGFSHVHHLMPLGEPHNGDDRLENLIVVCPNHHEDFENGMIEVDPGTLEIQHFYETELCGETIDTRRDHKIGRQYLAYQNEVIASDQI